jgi:VWFA-related protein
MNATAPPPATSSIRFATWLIAPALAAGFGVVTLAARQDAVFRAAVDLIAVDVQVVDHDGIPVGQIGPEAFTVSINGTPRRVVSAQFVRQAESFTVGLNGVKAAAHPTIDSAPMAEGRVFILAVDNSSFAPGTIRPAMEAAQHFIDALDEHDKIGLYVYPNGPRMEPSTDRAKIRASLSRVTGERWMPHSRFNLAPSEVIDMTAALGMGIQTRQNLIALDGTMPGPDGNGPGKVTVPPDWDTVVRVMRRECPGQADCAANILNDVASLAPHLENQAATSLNGLDVLLRALAEMPGRKAVVLVSAGVLVSDRKDGRPDVGDMSRVMGQTAAMANATVYSVHVESASSNPIASSRNIAPYNNRDRLLYGNWLDEFSTAAGGTRIYVPVGSGDFAFDRVLRETSAHYLLAVEPEETDRDGRPRQLKVKVARPGVSVQSRQWVVVPAKARAD